MVDRARYHLAAKDHDHDRGVGAGSPERSYVICSTPRTGSSLLSEALASIGVLGVPIEYFDRTSAHADCRRRWGCTDLRCFVRCLHRYRVGRHGVLGLKLHWFQLVELADELCPPVDRARLPERASRVLDEIAPGAAFVHLRRLDRERQATSWAIAESSGSWSRRCGEPAAPAPADISLGAIERCWRRIAEGDAGWAALFAHRGAEPLRVTYEELAGSYEATVQRVALWLGAPGIRIPPPALVRQSDECSELLAERFRSAVSRAGSGRER